MRAFAKRCRKRGRSVNDVLRWPGMFGDQSIDFATFNAPVLALAREVLDEFTASRGREGEKLAAMIVDRVNAMRDIVRNVAPRIPEAQALFADKLRQRLQEALGNASDDRIMQEVAVFATRIDVAEELSRLGTHLDEVERVLRQGGASGKRLDFLMQELNREANTLGSKSAITEGLASLGRSQAAHRADARADPEPGIVSAFSVLAGRSGQARLAFCDRASHARCIPAVLSHLFLR